MVTAIANTVAELSWSYSAMTPQAAWGLLKDWEREGPDEYAASVTLPDGSVLFGSICNECVTITIR